MYNLDFLSVLQKVKPTILDLMIHDRFACNKDGAGKYPRAVILRCLTSCPWVGHKAKMGVDYSNLDYLLNYRAVGVKWIVFRVVGVENKVTW